MTNNAFRTLHDKNYLRNSYLYHYSTFEKAIKVICSDKLRFGNIYSLNDTTEYKPKIAFLEDSPINDEIAKRCYEINHLIKVCCFTQDRMGMTLFKKEDDRYFSDYSGRGFALPRMWAQYSDNNKGVCFIINKEKLEQELKRKFTIISSGSINYVDRYPCFTFSKKGVNDFKSQVLNRETAQIPAHKFFETHPTYVKKNYLEKLSDWRDEYEFRIILFSSETETLALDKFSSFLEGIIVGENIDDIEVKIIKKLVKNNTPIKKIKFQHTSITLE